MGKQCLLGAAAALTLLSGACGTQNTPKGCTLTGHVSMPEYDMAYLADLDRHRVDSTALDGGDFRFSVADSVSRPYVMLLQLVDREEPLNQMDLPVMVENGTIQVGLGEYIHISGTPLNERVQDFLNALQACKDNLSARKGVTVEQIQSTFSGFYKEQILLNKDNVLGGYILRDYGVHLNAADRASVEAQLTSVP